MNNARAEISICVAILVLLSSAQAEQIATPVDVTLLESNENVTRIRYRIGEFGTEGMLIDSDEYYRVVLSGESNIMEECMPDLPCISRSIIVPNSARTEVHVTESRFDEYHLPVAPSRGFISRSVNPDDVPYEFSEAYSLNEFYPHSIAKLGSPYILRDFRGVTVSVYPVAYNPQTQTLRVYSHLVLEVRSTGTDYDNVKAGNSGWPNRYFDDIYRCRFLNYENHRYDLMGEQGRMIVVCYGGFMDAVQPYVDWKRQKGIPTDLHDVTTIGTTAEEIKDFIQAEYNADDGLTFVQFVGDAEHIPTFLIDRDFCDGQATSDPSYALLEGDDSYPDIFVGRFSASTVADVETQVERTIYYERALIGGDWLHKGICMGSAWGEGYGYMGLADRDLVELLRIMMIEYTYSYVDQLYEEGVPPYGIIPVPIEDFVNAVNDGRGLINVEGHADCEATFMIPPGSPSPGQVFLVDEVYDFVNDWMLPFVFIGAPYLGNFQIDVSYPEAWLRAVNDVTGAPIGAIAVYASSVDLDYASPQAAQYEMTDLLTTESMNTIGGLMYNGTCYAIDLYGSRGEKTSKSYHILGDVSLQVRTDTPKPLTVSHETTIASGSTSFEVTVFEVENALCAISRNYELLGYGYTSVIGHVVLEFDEPISGEEPLDFVVTALNKMTYIAQITTLPLECGDGDGSGDVDIDDVVYLIAYIFSGEPPPDPYESGDADCSGNVDIDDVVWLIAYIFSGANAPCDTDADEVPDC
jgi:hypothetical protein